MGKFQKFVARLFKIQPEDLQQLSEFKDQGDRAAPYTKEEINQLVQEQVSKAVKGINWPEGQEAVGQQASGIQKDLHEESQEQWPPTKQIEPTQEHNQELSIQSDDQPDLTATQQLDDNYPLLEEEALIHLDTEVIEPPVEESNQVENVVFPPVQDISPILEKDSMPLSDLEAELLVLSPIENEQIRIGIDFGTTTTAIAIKFGDDFPVALPIGLDGVTTYIPSVVYFAPGTGDLEQRITVGEEAEYFNDPSRTIRSVKRCIACKGNECEGNPRPFYCQSDGYIHLEAEEPIEPEFVARIILKEALQRAIDYCRNNKKIDLTEINICFLPVNVGCGAKFDLDRRNLLCRIADELGFTHFSIQNIVEEPILAGSAFTRFSRKSIGRSLIYDFGGGTFDAAIIEVDEDGEDRRVTILATSADNWLGGDDIDSLVYQYFLNQIASALGRSKQDFELSLSTNDAGRIRLRAKEAKESLSVHETYDKPFVLTALGIVDLHLDQLTFESLLQESNLAGKSLEVVLHACKLVSVYDKACQADVVNTQEIISLTLAKASSMIDHVVLVGGVTKIPFVRESLVKIFGKQKIIAETVIEPITAVAIGGAYAHDPNHFSIVVPPFGYFLKYLQNTETVKEYILKPFEFYDFNRLWATATVGAFRMTVDVLNDRPNAELHMERAGYEETTLLRPWNPLAMGTFTLTFSLDGSIGFQRDGQFINNLAPNHQRHPRQQAIVDARIEREEARRLEEVANWDQEDDLRHFAADP